MYGKTFLQISECNLVHNYIRIKAGTGILQSIVDDMNNKVDTLPDTMKSKELTTELHIVAISWIHKVFQKCLAKMMETNVCAVL
jgi:hypothetical protein